MPNQTGEPSTGDRVDRKIAQRLELAWQGAVARSSIRDFSRQTFVERATELLRERLTSAGVPATSTALLRVLDSVPVHGLFLLLAFRHGNKVDSTTALQVELMPLLVRSYRQLGASGEEAERCATDKLESLLFGAFRRDSSPGFLNYEARSSLDRWIAGVAWHDWRSRRRADSRLARPMSSVRSTESGEDWPLTIEDDLGRVPSTGQDDVHDLLVSALENARRSGRVRAPDLEAYACSILSRREHRHLAERLGIPPSTFARRKDRAASILAVTAREALLSRLDPLEYARLRESLDLDLKESNRTVLEAVRHFCRLALRKLRTGAEVPADGREESAS